MAGQFVPVKLNPEKDKEGAAASKKYDVSGFPSVVFLDGSGAVVGRIGGYLPPDGFSQEMKKVAAAQKELPLYQSRLKKNPKDVQAIGKLAAIYAGRGDSQRAAALLQNGEKVDPQNKGGYLAAAYNAVGDSLCENDQYDKAAPYYQKAAATGKSPRDVSAAHCNLAICRLQQNNAKAAITEAQAALKVPNAPADVKAQAQKVLDYAKRQSGQ